MERMAFLQRESQLELLSDEELIALIRCGDTTCQDQLLRKYKYLVKIKSRAYFLAGSDRDDIIQEGMIGLFKAIRDYDADKAASFYSFAELCITRQIYTAIKTATRKKHSPLNGYVSLNRVIGNDDSETTMGDMTESITTTDPETILIERENRQYIESRLVEALSPFETEVLKYYLVGKSYAQIAEITDKHVKSIDNAIQRIKRKIGKYVKEKTLDL